MKSRQKQRPNITEKKGIYVLPNLFTSASLFCGFYAIIAAMQGRYEVAATAILISCVFDVLDGKIARYTNTTSQFGTEYDSLSDLVAFGVAPGVLAYKWALEPFGRLGWLACFMYVICGALRLARFNTQKTSLETSHFKGLPIPAAASFIASLILFTTALDALPESKHILIIVLTYILSFLMVSTIEYLSLKELDLKKQKPFNVLVSVILMLMVIVYKPRIMLFPILTLYVMSGPALSLYRFQKKRIFTKDPVEEMPPGKKE